MLKRIAKINVNSIATIISIVLVCAMVIGIACFTSGCRSNTEEELSSSVESNVEVIVDEEVEIVEAEVNLEEDEEDEVTVAPEIIQPTVSQTNNSVDENINQENENNNPPADTSNQTNESTPNVVQKANPSTGISWDGVSPIIYTYSDGTTGTEPRDKAKYEAFPGVIWTLDWGEKAPIENPDNCRICGKLKGDGLNGTCTRWGGCDVNCPNCGVFVPQGTCHYCS